MCLLAQINPLATHHDDDEIRPVQLHHAHQVCGIVAHTKDHGVASVAIRSLAIAGSVLTEPREQHEVLDILARIYHHTGWNLNRVHLELKRAWGWEPREGASSGSGPGLPQPTPPSVLARSASQGGTMGAAAVITQLFGPRSADNKNNNNISSNSPNAGATTSSPHLSQPAPPPPPPPPPAPIHPPAMTTPNETRRANFTAGPPPPSTTLTQPLFSSSSSSSGVGGTMSSLQQQQQHRHGSSSVASGGGGGGSNHTSPAAATNNAHTPSASSTTNNAPTPPSNRVNPLLAQADFTQPNHPYREWYKPPESRTAAGGGGGFKAGGLWPY